MRDTEIGDRLRERNHWWRDERGWEEQDENLREAAAAPFEYRPGVLDDIRAGGLYTLSGPRRIGKSLELRRAIEALIERGVPGRNIIYCSCDGFSLQDLRRTFRVGESLTRGMTARMVVHRRDHLDRDGLVERGEGPSRRHPPAPRLPRADRVELARAAGSHQGLSPVAAVPGAGRSDRLLMPSPSATSAGCRRTARLP